ncbi:MAG: RNase P subunit p30 family protein [Halobacteriaceae archaeon]
MYEAVTAYPAGDSTVSRLAVTAASRGYDGLVVRTPEATGNPEEIADRYGVDIVEGVEIDATDPSVVAGHVGTKRPETSVLMVRGGSPTINRYAVEEPRVDVLTAPMSGEGDINHVLAAAAARNDVRIEFRLGPVLRSQGGERVQALSRLRKLREIIADSDADHVVSADPMSHHHLRSITDLKALGAVIGFDPATIETGMAEWGSIAATNRERHTDTVPEPGVRIEDDTDGGDRE